LRKVLAVSLAAAMMAGTGFTSAGQFVGTDTSVSAYSYEEFTYGDFKYQINDDDTITLTRYTGKGGDVVIPGTIDGRTVTKTAGYYTYSESWFGLFYRLNTLTSVTYPDSITTVGWGECCFCENLKSVTFGKGLTEIPPSSFEYCIGLESVTVPEGVTEISGGAFNRCWAFREINVVENNKTYSSDNGILFNKDKTEVIFCPRAKKGTYTLPNSVTVIGSDAFYECGGLTNVTIPDGVEKIGSNAFYGCTGLKDIAIPKSVTFIDRRAFFDCTGVKNTYVPASVTEIGEEAFGYRYYNSKRDDFTLFGEAGSAVAAYADENELPFVSEFANVSDISDGEIMLGDTVEIDAKALMGEGDYTYAALYKKKADKKWTVKQNYSTNDVITIKPAKATDYDVCVKVKDSTGKIVKKFFELKVNEKLKNTSTISAATIKKGNTVTLKGSAAGGVGDYTYAVLYKKKSETKWTVRQGYKDNDEILVRPYTNTDYDICIKVKDEKDHIAKKYFTVTVTK